MEVKTLNPRDCSHPTAQPHVYPIYFLIVLPFKPLRAVPPGAFTDVNWSIYIPHPSGKTA
ncbi:hypothetical protein B0H17DRAFT_1047119 [Mycena rosella]|uniref:Uncharacterized protein n=1 Tax=Mycena rosella TaxID=1033263 RepID=A0AAD7GLJ2_MYCRO|nr:hypothetical protein B0H17DRAFT_1047119 [Mycena rosella]